MGLSLTRQLHEAQQRLRRDERELASALASKHRDASRVRGIEKRIEDARRAVSSLEKTMKGDGLFLEGE